ncbi:MAG: PAC2 family protein [Dehalococcoidia bacterium]|jgi:proteasome assembly chaperone (PAC2) family protein
MKQPDPKLLKIHFDPSLKEPYLIAAGPGTANVGLRVASYLQEKLGAELFAEIEPGDFFTPPYSFNFRDGVIETAPLEETEPKPRNRFYYWKSGQDHDIIFFTGNTHPLPGKVPELAGYVLDIAKGLDMRRLYMPGAFLTDIHHLTEPTLYGSSTSPELREYLHQQQIADVPSMNIANNLNAWLLGMAKSKGVDAVGIISEIPAYKPEERNIRACRALVRALLRMLDIEAPDIADLDVLLDEEDKRTEAQLDELRQSANERAVDFLNYLDRLAEREQEMAQERGILPSAIALPESLKFIETLYEKARQDPKIVPELRQAVQQLESSDRLLIMRKYGEEIMSLLGYQV